MLRRFRLEGEIPDDCLFPMLRGSYPEMRFPERFGLQLGEQGDCFFPVFSPSVLG